MSRNAKKTNKLILQERERLYVKFHPHSVLTANISAHKNVANNPHSQTTGILKKQPLSKSLTAPSCNPATFPGRLTLKSAFNSNCAQDDLSVNDQEKCILLLKNYRKQVLKGDICAGDCPNDGISCMTGVCRAHLRYMYILYMLSNNLILRFLNSYT